MLYATLLIEELRHTFLLYSHRFRVTSRTMPRSDNRCNGLVFYTSYVHNEPFHINFKYICTQGTQLENTVLRIIWFRVTYYSSVLLFRVALILWNTQTLPYPFDALKSSRPPFLEVYFSISPFDSVRETTTHFLH